MIDRDTLLKKYRTTTPEGYPTFDLERYYDDMSIEEMTALRDKTVKGLEKYPDFGTRFYTEFVEYLNKKLEIKGK